MSAIQLVQGTAFGRSLVAKIPLPLEVLVCRTTMPSTTWHLHTLREGSWRVLAIRLALPLCRDDCKCDGSYVLRYQQSETIAKIIKARRHVVLRLSIFKANIPCIYNVINIILNGVILLSLAGVFSGVRRQLLVIDLLISRSADQSGIDQTGK